MRLIPILKMRSLSGFVAACLLSILALPAVADTTPNYQREARIGEQIEPMIFDGEAVWLDANDRQFLGIFIAAETSHTAVLLLHGRDVSPEEQNLIGPLRVGLAENGYATLALQMPVLAKGKTYNDYLPILDFARERIEAGISYLRDAGYQRVVLAAHSCGAHMANNWLNATGDDQIDAYIAMGLGATDAGQELKTPFPIGEMAVPVLDIYGLNEFPRPLAMLPERRALLAKNGHAASAQIGIADADHYFTNQGAAMTDALTGWIAELP